MHIDAVENRKFVDLEWKSAKRKEDQALACFWCKQNLIQMKTVHSDNSNCSRTVLLVIQTAVSLKRKENHNLITCLMVKCRERNEIPRQVIFLMHT